MARRQLLALAIGGESLLVVVALLWIWLRAIPVHATGGPWQRDAAMGVAAAGVLAVVNWALLCRAPDVSGVRGIRRLCWDMLRPLFAAVAPRDVVIIGVAAGVGEELLFRGALQPEAGLVAASVVFGLLHMGGRGTFAFGCWAMAMGAALGWLAVWTGGLLAPVVAHAVYDAAAIAYLRWGSVCDPLRPGAVH